MRGRNRSCEVLPAEHSGGVIFFDILSNNYRIETSDERKAIETGMILLNMDMKNQLLCVFFIDLY